MFIFHKFEFQSKLKTLTVKFRAQRTTKIVILSKIKTSSITDVSLGKLESKTGPGGPKNKTTNPKEDL